MTTRQEHLEYLVEELEAQVHRNGQTIQTLAQRLGRAEGNAFHYLQDWRDNLVQAAMRQPDLVSRLREARSELNEISTANVAAE